MDGKHCACHGCQVRIPELERRISILARRLADSLGLERVDAVKLTDREVVKDILWLRDR
jgi:hypothetical protein